MTKRCVDVLLSGIALLVLWPVMILLAVMIRIKLGSPVVFKQHRPGLGGKPFIMYKFRSMTNECDCLGKLLPDAQRMTRLGRFMRSTSMDELPELWNVLRGDMSLVGPRPLLMEYLELYSPEQMRRHEVRPGMTGWAQVNGRNQLSWAEKFSMDIWYINHCSTFLDFWILIRTVFCLFRRNDINASGEATASRFEGN